ncbi:lysophospholipid acyltransferase family protein [Tsukamurella sp. 8F]|uniref:lysophospholipid acyltransferase family protein n=1 Tax=unclassified Tsukamurella TaxID=2633480 RepID=UPI0023B8A007|nr:MULTISPECIES: lysophospholipid acyltransferase family protein [unclassified Tsukamurella]MDF0532017.1 lysophospholipid acyltransferase family protein [Tsukamurella sp. 8J]MDF0588422.1 lysophospholipid acyltransferase family protein [Tsukamurella sp. 8F]
MWWMVFKWVVIGPVLRVIGRPRVEGLENLPKNGSAIVASNHLAVMDSFFLPLMVPRRIRFLAKSEYFTGKGPKGVFQKWFFTSVGCIPIHRGSAGAAQDALDAGVGVLQSGELLGLYPEGTRSPDGRLFKGKTGMARMALETGAKIIPVAMVNTEKFNPPGTTLPRFTHVKVRIGEPLDFSRFDGMAGNRFIERAITDEVMYELMRLSGQPYVDVYAADVKNGVVEAPGGESAA